MFLRFWQADDAQQLLDLIHEAPDLSRQFPPIKDTVEVEDFLRTHYLPAENRAVFCIEHEEMIAGCIGIDFTARNENGDWDRGWVYYWNTPNIRGKGIMKRTVSAVCGWALGDLPQTGQETVRFIQK